MCRNKSKLERQDQHSRPGHIGPDGTNAIAAASNLASSVAGFRSLVSSPAGMRHDDNEGAAIPRPGDGGLLAAARIGMRPHASIGTAVSLPACSSNSARSGSLVPNPDLKPEQELGWDAGIEFTLSGGRDNPRRHLFPRQPDGRDRWFRHHPSSTSTLYSGKRRGTSIREAWKCRARQTRAMELSSGCRLHLYSTPANPTAPGNASSQQSAARADLGYTFRRWPRHV